MANPRSSRATLGRLPRGLLRISKAGDSTSSLGTCVIAECGFCGGSNGCSPSLGWDTTTHLQKKSLIQVQNITRCYCPTGRSQRVGTCWGRALGSPRLCPGDRRWLCVGSAGTGQHLAGEHGGMQGLPGPAPRRAHCHNTSAGSYPRGVGERLKPGRLEKETNGPLVTRAESL